MSGTQILMIQMSESDLDKKIKLIALAAYKQGRADAESDDELITSEEVSKMLNCSKRTVYRLKSDGKITPRRTDGKDLYSKKEIIEFRK